MKSLFVIIIGLLSLQSFAGTNNFDIKAELSIHGKLVARPHIVAIPNEMVTIRQMDGNHKETLIEMVASEVKDGVMMKFTVIYIENGKNTVISKPQILALFGEPAEITVGEDGEQETLNLKVIATRVQ
jgi:hypothetical protein